MIESLQIMKLREAGKLQYLPQAQQSIMPTLQLIPSIWQMSC